MPKRRLTLDELRRAARLVTRELAVKNGPSFGAVSSEKPAASFELGSQVVAEMKKVWEAMHPVR